MTKTGVFQVVLSMTMVSSHLSTPASGSMVQVMADATARSTMSGYQSGWYSFRETRCGRSLHQKESCTSAILKCGVKPTHGGWWWTKNQATGRLLYRGSSLREWTFDRVLAHADAGESYMWECPDFFALAMGVLDVFPAGNECRGIQLPKSLSESGVIPGMHSQDDFCTMRAFTELDNGHDFYAPQSFLAKDGRRIVIGWMDIWGIANALKT